MTDFLFSLQGRTSRRDFWMSFELPVLCAVSVLGILMGLLHAAHPEAGHAARLATDAFDLIVAWPSFAISARRCHDTGYPGWYVLVRLVPLVGPVLFDITIGAFRGEPGRNRFGEAP
jgi:uncharacterized membrane protein YhaH (DUF805 family)